MVLAATVFRRFQVVAVPIVFVQAIEPLHLHFLVFAEGTNFALYHQPAKSASPEGEEYLFPELLCCHLISKEQLILAYFALPSTTASFFRASFH
jgi:hypothetical protein